MTSLTIAKSLIELIGVFLLSVEAIRIDNLTRLIARLSANSEWAARVGNIFVPGLVTAFLVAAGLVGATILIERFLVAGSTVWLISRFITALSVFAAVGGLLAVVSTLTLRWFNNGVISFLNLVEQKTPTGTAGIIGFFLVLLSKAGEIGLLLLEPKHPLSP